MTFCETIVDRRDACSNVFSPRGLLLGVVGQPAQYGLFSHAFTQQGCLASL